MCEQENAMTQLPLGIIPGAGTEGRVEGSGHDQTGGMRAWSRAVVPIKGGSDCC